MSGRLRAVREHPSAVLLVAQMVAVLAYPFLDQNAWSRSMIGVVQLAVVLAALASVRRTPSLTWVAALFGAPAMVLTVVEAIEPHSEAITLASALFHAPFYFYVSFAMIRYLFHDEKVTRDELFATGAAFTVVAWGFAYVFSACQVVWSGSFIDASGGGDRDWFELLFLSFSTLTSVGLSDVIPVQGHARSLVMIEMVAGVFYVALVVARLVSLAVVKERPEA